MTKDEYEKAVTVCKAYIGQTFTQTLGEQIEEKSGMLRVDGIKAGFVGHYGDTRALLMLDEHQKIISIIVRPTEDTFK
ncbi:hypothetical protein [Pseudomonas sp. nanlin1]|uniref:hypothetical protein n=1 Tax=Pseudomonas sp. nanlin1 TaxID=3040605 RepID=UPI00388E425E